MNFIDGLDKVSIFQDLTVPQLEQISTFCRELELDAGDMLIEESDKQNTDIYILMRGKVEIVSNAASITSSEVVISRAEMDVFGEIAWLARCKRTASVRCHGDVLAVRVDGPALQSYLEVHPDAGYHVMRRIALTLSKRMMDADNLLKQILWNTVL